MRRPKMARSSEIFPGPSFWSSLFGNSAVQFDMGKFRYLAVPVSETYVFIVTRKPGVAKFEEILGDKAKR